MQVKSEGLTAAEKTRRKSLLAKGRPRPFSEAKRDAICFLFARLVTDSGRSPVEFATYMVVTKRTIFAYATPNGQCALKIAELRRVCKWLGVLDAEEPNIKKIEAMV